MGGVTLDFTSTVFNISVANQNQVVFKLALALTVVI
jgi:hypothetical protein